MLAHGITCALRVWAYQIADLVHRLPRHRVRPPRARQERGAAAPPSLQPRASWRPISTPCSRRRWPRPTVPSSPDTRWVASRSHRGRAVSRTGTGARRCRRADQHHHRRPPAPRPVAAGARATGRCAGACGGDPAEDVRRRAASASGGAGEPAVRLHDRGGPRRRARTSPNSSTSCSPRHRPQAAAAGPAPWSTRSGAEHIDLTNLTAPTLVIGSTKDRLLPMVSSRHIARMAPNLATFVELPGGRCEIVERPEEVNKHLRVLIESVSRKRSS